MPSFETALAVAGAAYVAVFGIRKSLALRSWSKRAGYLPVSCTVAPEDPVADGPAADADEDDDVARVSADRAKRDSALASEAEKYRRWTKNVLAFQLPLLASAVSLSAGSLYFVAKDGGDNWFNVGVATASSAAWVRVM
ncbi:hypothetical protein BDK51DRAFT_38319 [Blyttiomyces helicus]|uniref:Uncharacterized protein n=1 Tax=Blyttiomyces helicus TaxID=388810 RepID=A0A4P9W1W7_9FUNG|nr:hypothetical protein BDK51DRAFT_38319 [Blyttiomyces helicus]|eukprot:RKO86189.1 hypothetical protein BDK51DRAFT_38319 [Blyttiomyces helicus]